MPRGMTRGFKTGSQAGKGGSRARSRQATAATRASVLRRVREIGPFNVQPTLRGEKKSHDHGQTVMQINNSLQKTLLNDIGAGTAATQRIGRRIFPKSLHIKAWIHPPRASRIGRADMITISVIFDKQANGQAFNEADLLHGSAAAANALSFNNLNNSNRFITLYKQSVAVGEVPQLNTNTSTRSFGPNTFFLDINVRSLEKKVSVVNYSGTGSGIADISEGAFFLTCSGMHDPDADEEYLIAFNSRLRYTD